MAAGYYDKDLPVQIYEDYFSTAGRPEELRAPVRSDNLTRELAGMREPIDGANSDSTIVATFAKHVGPVRQISLLSIHGFNSMRSVCLCVPKF